MTNRVLITGITGMTGSYLADLLVAEAPHLQIFGTKRWRSSLRNNAENLAKLHLMDCDLRDSSACDSLIEQVRPDYVFHLAAQTYVPDSWVNPRATIYDNVQMEINLFEAIRKARIEPIVQVALSSEEYGNIAGSELPITEVTPFRPSSPYGVSKVIQDMLAYQYYKSYGMKIIRTRSFNHEAPRRPDVFVTSNLAKQIAEIELGKRRPVVFAGNLEAKRDWSDARDIARAYWLAVQKCLPGEDYVIGSGITRSIKELLDTLLRMSKIKVEVVLDKERIRPSDIFVLQADASKFRKATGWQPAYSFEQTMSDILNYWRSCI